MKNMNTFKKLFIPLLKNNLTKILLTVFIMSLFSQSYLAYATTNPDDPDGVAIPSSVNQNSELFKTIKWSVIFRMEPITYPTLSTA